MPSLLIWVLLVPVLGHALPEDIGKAPPSFSYQGKKIVPVDILSQQLSYELDVKNARGIGKSKIQFTITEAGYPMLDLVPSPSEVILNQTSLGSLGFPLVTTPDGAAKVRYVNTAVSERGVHTLELTFPLTIDQVTFSGVGAAMGWFMGDVSSERKFLERYAPSNFEYDAFKLNLSLKILGSNTTHQFYANGKVQEMGTNAWEVDFPEYFTTSSFFMHVSYRNFSVKQAMYTGLERSIPITIYSDYSSLSQSGLQRALETMKELEADYGPFTHEKFIAYMTESGGGMEHCGATVTSLGALEHEMTHSWFARGVMPANGNAGWIDEAIASWRDGNYPSYSSTPSESSVNLANFSPYRRTTPIEAYSDGMQLLGHFDHLFRDGLKVVLRDLFQKYKRQTITTATFKSFLESSSGISLESLFKKYVYGHAENRTPGVHWNIGSSRHPKPLTDREMETLR